MSTGRIVRQVLPFENRFTQIPNAWLRDRSVTLKARGLLSMLWSYPADFEVTIVALERDGHGGRDLITAAVNELETAGYLTRRPRRKRGAVVSYDWVITDPLSIHSTTLLTPSGPVDNYVPENPAREVHVPENPARYVPENPAPIKNTINTLKEVPGVTTEPPRSPVDNCAGGLGKHRVIYHDGRAIGCEIGCLDDYNYRESLVHQAVSS